MNKLCKNQHKLIVSSIILLLLLCCAEIVNAQKHLDLLINDGKILDGTGNPWYYADVGVKGDRIVVVGDLTEVSAKDTIDAKGLYVSPGFIDVHSHSGPGLEDPKLSGAEPLLRQGVTSVVINPDGGGDIDLEKQKRKLLKHGLGVNVAQLVPHGSIREEVIGMADRAPNPAEMEQMKQLVNKGMQNGAFGLSSGPFYSPGSFASTQELIELADVAAKYGGIYTSHIRDESNYTIGLGAAVDEVIEIARKAELPGIITHIKALGPPVWDLSSTIVENIENAREEGVEVFADQYPYEASATGLISALVPRWAEEGGHDALVKRLEDPETRSKIKTAMNQNLKRRGGADRIQFRYYDPDSTIEGKTLKDLSEERDKASLEVAIALISKGEPGIVSFNMKEEDVHRFMQQSWTMTCSDGGLVPMGQGVPHPRNYGAFPRKIRKYVVEQNAISLSQAIRSMTNLPAAVFNFENRGLIREGMTADIAIFDLDAVKDNAGFQAPHQLSEGMIHVLVNGSFAIKDESFIDTRTGQVLKH